MTCVYKICEHLVIRTKFTNVETPSLYINEYLFLMISSEIVHVMFVFNIAKTKQERINSYNLRGEGLYRESKRRSQWDACAVRYF